MGAHAQEISNEEVELQKNPHFSLEQLKEKKQLFLDQFPNGMDLDTFTAFLQTKDKTYATMIFNAIDTDHNGIINPQEWLVYASIISTGTPQEQLEFQFLIYDLNQDGFITADELAHIVRLQIKTGNIPLAALLHHKHYWEVGRRTPEGLARSFLQHCDLNHDDKIGLNEFSCIVEEILSLITYKEPPKIRPATIRVDKDFLRPGNSL